MGQGDKRARDREGQAESMKGSGEGVLDIKDREFGVLTLQERNTRAIATHH